MCVCVCCGPKANPLINNWIDARWCADARSKDSCSITSSRRVEIRNARGHFNMLARRVMEFAIPVYRVCRCGWRSDALSQTMCEWPRARRRHWQRSAEEGTKYGAELGEEVDYAGSLLWIMRCAVWWDARISKWIGVCVCVWMCVCVWNVLETVMDGWMDKRWITC